ncbi:MAG TPA: NAD(P)-dependent oxidoreductase [Marmoricola sp.]|nr:NAD(P)-dependent oxidoreductase [Marmoricola sp.]
MDDVPASAEMTSVGFVGLGHMGQRMATRLLDVPGGLIVFDPDLAAAAPLVERGATMASGIAHLAELSDVVCVRVAGDELTRQVVGELVTAAAPDATVAVHSAIRPATVAELAARAGPLGVRVLDAAMSGGPTAAEQGRLAFLVGGSYAGLVALRPVLDRMGDLVVHLGAAGAGTRARLAHNLLHYVSLAAAGEASRLAEAAGIDPAVLGQVVRHSESVTGGPGSMMWRATAEPMAEDDPWRAVFGRLWAVGERDLHHAVELASRLGVDTPLADVSLRELGPALGLGEPA